jgi:hypothetical protein
MHQYKNNLVYPCRTTHSRKMAATNVPIEVILSMVPKLLDTFDISNIAQVSLSWREHKDRLLKEHVIAKICKLLPRNDTPNNHALLYVLPYNDIEYVYECAIEIAQLEPCPWFCELPSDWVEVALQYKDHRRGKLYLLEHVFEYTSHCFTKQTPVHNGTIYKGKYISGVLDTLAFTMLDYYDDNITDVDEAMFNNMCRQVHLTPGSRSWQEYIATMEWMRRVIKWFQSYEDIIDANLPHGQVMTYMMQDVLHNFTSNPTMVRRLYKHYHSRNYLLKWYLGGLLVTTEDERYDSDSEFDEDTFIPDTRVKRWIHDQSATLTSKCNYLFAEVYLYQLDITHSVCYIKKLFE